MSDIRDEDGLAGVVLFNRARDNCLSKDHFALSECARFASRALCESGGFAGNLLTGYGGAFIRKRDGGDEEPERSVDKSR